MRQGASNSSNLVILSCLSISCALLHCIKPTCSSDIEGAMFLHQPYFRAGSSKSLCNSLSVFLVPSHVGAEEWRHNTYYYTHYFVVHFDGTPERVAMSDRPSHGPEDKSK